LARSDCLMLPTFLLPMLLFRSVAALCPLLPLNASPSPRLDCVNNNRELSCSTALCVAACCARDLLAAAPELASVASTERRIACALLWLFLSLAT